MNDRLKKNEDTRTWYDKADSVVAVTILIMIAGIIGIWMLTADGWPATLTEDTKYAAPGTWVAPRSGRAVVNAEDVRTSGGQDLQTTINSLSAPGGIDDQTIGNKAFRNPPSDLTNTEQQAVRTAIGAGTGGGGGTGDIEGVTAGQGLSGGGTSGTVTLNVQDCAANQILKRNAGDTDWVCAADNTGAGGGGDITGVTAGTGLSGGGTTGTVTLSVTNPFTDADETKLDNAVVTDQLTGGTNDFYSNYATTATLNIVTDFRGVWGLSTRTSGAPNFGSDTDASLGSLTTGTYTFVVGANQFTQGGENYRAVTDAELGQLRALGPFDPPSSARLTLSNIGTRTPVGTGNGRYFYFTATVTRTGTPGTATYRFADVTPTHLDVVISQGNVYGLTDAAIGDKAFSNPPSDLTSTEKTAVIDAVDAVPDPGSCTAGQIVKRNSGNTAWECASDETATGGGGTGDITAVSAGQGLSGGGTSGAVTLNVQDCAANQILKRNSGDTDWVCAADSGGTGDITAVVAGTGLSGGATSGSATLNISNGGVTNTQIANDTIQEAKLDVTNSPTDNYILSYDSTSAGFTWVQDAQGTGDITGVTAGQGLSGGGTSGAVTLNVQDCAANEVLKRNAGDTDWVCASDANAGGDITGVTAGQGLSGGGTSGAVTLNVQDCAANQILQRNAGDTDWVCAAPPTGGGSGDITAVVAGQGLSGGATSGSATLNVQDCAAGQILIRNVGDTDWECGNAPGTAFATATTTIRRRTFGTALVQDPFTLNTAVTQAHGLGRVPDGVYAYIQNKTAEKGYAVGDRVSVGNWWDTALTYDATNLHFYAGNAQGLQNKAADQRFGIDPADWLFTAVPYIDEDLTVVTGVTGGGTGDITGVTANQGLSGGGASGAVTVGMKDCNANQILKRNAGDTDWDCSADGIGAVGLVLNQGLRTVAGTGANVGTTFIGIQDCAANQIMKRNAADTQWECAADGGGGGGGSGFTRVQIFSDTTDSGRTTTGNFDLNNATASNNNFDNYHFVSFVIDALSTSSKQDSVCVVSVATLKSLEASDELYVCNTSLSTTNYFMTFRYVDTNTLRLHSRQGVGLAAIYGFTFGGGGTIGDGSIEAVKLESTNTRTDNARLSYDATSGGFTWETPPGVTEIYSAGSAFNSRNTSTSNIDLNNSTTALNSFDLYDSLTFIVDSNTGNPSSCTFPVVFFKTTTITTNQQIACPEGNLGEVGLAYIDDNTFRRPSGAGAVRKVYGHKY